MHHERRPVLRTDSVGSTIHACSTTAFQSLDPTVETTKQGATKFASEIDPILELIETAIDREGQSSPIVFATSFRVALFCPN